MARTNAAKRRAKTVREKLEQIWRERSCIFPNNRCRFRRKVESDDLSVYRGASVVPDDCDLEGQLTF